MLLDVFEGFKIAPAKVVFPLLRFILNGTSMIVPALSYRQSVKSSPSYAVPMFHLDIFESCARRAIEPLPGVTLRPIVR